ncbi:uncharacterized protein C8Q71DRAFT_431732 [Rhodofomes roseus]|uniref:Secreted protein n=1 Tax=Rhodofomes roseus TaxID=34475 RepID=A0ABQ8KQN3_9APHY|nr:uncharacterized protein C8Q71DRAFT_431732 [Rhodofomes roseus]KAH9840936.1 hypothetical protein C8Q71DRAFT_431732 [Rhodofomes roseus]
MTWKPRRLGSRSLLYWPAVTMPHATLGTDIPESRHSTRLMAPGVLRYILIMSRTHLNFSEAALSSAKGARRTGAPLRCES